MYIKLKPVFRHYCFASQFHAEELQLVENGCHDNPMLDVANDSHPVMQEVKPNTNGLLGGEDAGGEDSNCWQVVESLAKRKTIESQQWHQLFRACQKCSGRKIHNNNNNINKSLLCEIPYLFFPTGVSQSSNWGGRWGGRHTSLMEK